MLGDGTPVFRSDLSDAERSLLMPVFLLTNKPVLVVVNSGEDQNEVMVEYDHDMAIVTTMRGKLEMELTQFGAAGDEVSVIRMR